MVALPPTSALVLGGYDKSLRNMPRDLEVYDGVSGRSYTLPFKLLFGRVDVEPAWLADGTLLVCDNGVPERVTASPVHRSHAPSPPRPDTRPPARASGRISDSTGSAKREPGQEDP